MRQSNRPSPLARFTGICLCLLMPVITLPVPLSAATLIWDPAQDQTGSGGAGIWNTSTANWLGGGGDVSWINTNGDTAAFQGTGGLVSVAANIGAGGLIFNGPGYTLGGSGAPQVLTLGTGGITVGSSSGTITVGDLNLSLLLSASESFTNSSTGLLTLAGSISNGGNLLTLGNTSSGGLTISGAISGTGGLTINSTGAGVVTLSGSNSYTGPTSILGGTLKLGRAYALSSGSALTLANAAGVTLDLNGFSQSVGGLSGGGALGGNVVLGNGAVLTIGGALTPQPGGFAQNINVSTIGLSNTYAGQISGSGSLAITGGVSLALTNNNNTYSGFTNILGGTLIISNMGQLGTSTTTVNIGGVAGNLGGGALLLQGGTTGLNFTRNLNVAGYGIGGATNSPSYSLVSVGNNTFSGILTSGSSSGETRIGSAVGTLQFTGTSTINVGGISYLMTNAAGNTAYNGFLTGGVPGSLGFYRWSGGALLGEVSLGNPYSNLLGGVEVTGSFLRIASPGAVGVGVANNSFISYGGSFELRVDPGNTDFSKKTLSYSAAGSAVIAARAVGGVGINQTITIGGASVNGVISPGFNEAFTTSAVSTTFNGNDGYGVMIGAGGTIAYGFTAGAGVNHGYISNLNGLLTLNSSFSSSDTAATRTYTITANGDVLLTGNMLSTAGVVDHIWSKAGYGALAIQGTASTNIGVFNITNGSVYVNALSSLNINTTTGAGSGGVQMGSLTLNGILNYLGSTASGAGETTNKAVILAGTTGSGGLFANQQQSAANTSATALMLSSSIAAVGVGNKTLYLEGYNNTGTAAVINQITGVIQDNATVNISNKTSLLKGGSGTWLYAPTASTYAAATVAAGASMTTTSTTTALGGTVLNLPSTTGLAVGQQVFGTGIAAGSYITALTSTTVTLNVGTTAAITSGAIVFGGEAAAVATTAISAANTNTITLTSVAGLVVGQGVTGSNVPAGTVITAIYGSSVVLNNTIVTAIAASSTLYFGSVGATGIAQSFTGAVTVAGGTLQVQPTAGSGNGSAPLSSSNNLTFATDPMTGNGYAGGTFQMLGSAAAGTMTMTVGQLIPTAGQGNILTTANGGTPTLTFGFPTTPIGTRGAGAVLNFSPGTGTTIQFTTTPTILNGIIGLGTTVKGFAYYTNPTTSAVDFAAVTGSGPYVVAPYSSYVSGLPTSGSTGTSTYWLSGGTVTTTAAETISALKISGSTSLTLGGVLTLGAASSTSAVLFDNSTGSATISASAAGNTLGGATSEIIVYTGGSTNANTLTIGALISSGAGSLTKAGAGTLIISGANTFSGNVNIDQGILKLSGAAATLGVISTANVTAVRQDATLDLNAAGAGGSVTIGALTGAGTITNSGGASGTAAATLIIGLAGTASTTATFSGLLQDGTGVLNVTKNGTTGVQYFNPLNGAASSTSPTGSVLGSIGYNTYSGVTTIAEGTLGITLLANYGKASGIGTGNAQGNAASLVLGNSASATAGILQYIGQNSNSFLSMVESPSVQTDRLFTLAGNGGLDSSGGFGNSAVGAGNINSAVIWFTNTAAVGFSTAGAKTLTLQGTSTGDNEIDLKLIDNTIDSTALSVTKAGAGTWILGNTGNTYSGATTISLGVLRAQDGGSNATTATAASSSVSSNVLDLASTAGLAVGQAVSGVGIAPGTVIASILGPLQIQLSSVNTVAGGTALTFGSISSLSANSNLVLAGGIFETSGTFTRALGTGAGQVQWTSSGGFAASGSALTVAIGGLANPTKLVFGTAPFNTSTLLLGSATALSDTTLLNPLDLNGSARAITITANATTAADIYTMAGVISGATGSSLTLTVPANTMLLINGANTYSGNTTISGAGAIAVQSIGSAGSTSSSFGDASGQLNIGNGGTVGGYLLYAGGGETASRTINLNSTGTATIDASGSGPLILTSITNFVAGAKVLQLVGQSRDANTITAVLADNGGALSVTKGNGGTWILTGANTFTGTVTVSDGFLGIGAGWSSISSSAANPLGMNATILTMGADGGLFTLNPGGTTITSPVAVAGGNFTFSGLNSIAFTGATTFSFATATTLSNNIGPAGSLRFGGAMTLTVPANGLILNGTGNTIFDVGLPGNMAGVLTISTLGTVTLNAATTFTGGISLLQGTLIANARNAFGSGTFSFGTGTLTAGTLPLTGADAVTNAVLLTSSADVISGSNSIELAGVVGMAASRLVTNNIDSSSGASLLFSGSISNTALSTLTFGGSGNTTVSGAYVVGVGGANALAYSGTGTLTLTAANLYTGATTLNSGTTVLKGANGAFTGSSGITVNQSAILTLDNSITAAAANRLGNHPLTLAGGTLNFIGKSTGSTEGTAGGTAGTLILGSGQSLINITSNGGTTTLNFASLTATTAGSTLNITSNATLGTATNQVNFGSSLNTSAATVTGTTLTFASTAGLVAGQAVSGAGILNGTTISSFTGTTVTLSQAVAASGVTSASAITFGLPMSGGTGGAANALLPRIIIGGTAWATTGANGLTAFSNFSTPSDVTLASLIATPTIALQVSGSTTNALYSAGAAAGGRILNALSINGSGLTVGVGTDAATTLASDLSLTLGSGGILVNGGTNTLNATRIVLAPINVTTTVAPAAAGGEAIIQVASGATLNLGGALVGSLMTNTNVAGTNFYANSTAPVASMAIGGLTKGLSGNLNITSRQFYTGPTTLNGGTTTLMAGNNTLFDNGGALAVNYGATLDLNGTVEYVGNILSNATGLVWGAGGTITSSSAALLVSNATTATWGGSITGTITYVRVNGNTTTMDAANTYSGATIILGGGIALQDNGTLSNTSSITLNYSSLSFNNNSDLFINNNDRVNDAAPITLNGGAITFTGRINTYTSESLGALTAVSGFSTITDATGGGTYANADLSFASITHVAGAVLNFAGASLGSEAAAPRILVADNGASLGYSTATGVIGSWAIANSDTWAGYNPSMGIGAVGTDGYQGFDGGYMSGGTVTTTTALLGANVLNTYTGGTLNGFGAGKVTNILNGIVGINQVITLNAGGATTDYLRFAGVAENDLAFTNPTDVLNIIKGGLLHSNSTVGSTIIGTSAVRGVLTSGGTATTGSTELVIFNTALTTAQAAAAVATGAASNATVLNSNTVSVTSTTGLFAGMGITGTGIPAGAYITQVVNGTQFTINYNATSTAAGQTLSFVPNIVINSSIQNNGLGNLTQLIKSGTGLLTLTAANTYTGGTVINQGTLSLDGAAGTVVLPSGGITLVGGITGGVATTLNIGISGVGGNAVGIGGQIDPNNTLTLFGKSTVNLAGTQALNSLVFNNNGGEGAPNVTTATTIPVSVLNLTSSSPITASSSNPFTVSLISVASLGLAAGTNTITVNPIQIAGSTVTQLTAALNISSPIVGIGTTGAGVGISKAGNGMLQLSSGSSTFDGGVNLTAGGIAIAASSTSVAGAVTSGPLGTGTFTIGAGTYLTSNLSTNVIGNALVLGGNDLNFKGLTGLTLNGTVNLNAGATTVNVDVPGTFLTLGGVVTDNGGAGGGTSSIIKNGLGTLALTNNDTFGGSITVNAGVLVLGGATGNTPQPMLNPSVTLTSNGTLALENNGLYSNGLIVYQGLAITLNPSSNYANLFVGNATTVGVALVAANGTGNAIKVPQLTMSGTQVLNLGSANAYTLIIQNLTDTTGAPRINVPSGMTAYVYNYSAGNKPINIGQGTLYIPDSTILGTTTTVATNPIELSTYNGSNYYPIVIQAPATAPVTTPSGYTSGGLAASYSSLGAAQGIINVNVAGIGSSGTGTVSSLNDASMSNRASDTTAAFTNGITTLQGLLQITAGGTYTFRSASDDAGLLYIDGQLVLTDRGPHSGITEAAGSGQITLGSGYHTITYTAYNATLSGSYRLLYAGADTAGNNVPDTVAGATGGFQAIPSSKLFYAAAAPTAANKYNFAAVINNNYTLATGTSATIDTLASPLGAVIAPAAGTAMVLGSNSQLNIVNGSSGVYGAGWVGVDGPITVGNGVVIATTNTASQGAGTLNLIGAITQSGGGAANALFKAGTGSLILGGNNTAFTGDLVIQGGFVQLNSATALSTGSNGSLGGTLIRNINTASTSLPTVASGSATLTLAGTDTAGSLTLQIGMAVSGAGIPVGTYITAISGLNVTLSQAATAPGSGTYYFNASGMLDLNGVTGVTGNITINGIGALIPSASATPAAILAAGSSGALWNSSPTAASLTGTLTLGSSATVGGNGDLTLNAIVGGAGITLTKQGTDTLILNASNGAQVFATSIALGTLKLGNIGAFGVGTNAVTIASGAVFDLNGLTVTNANPLSITSLGYGGSSTITGSGTVSSLGSLINTSTTAASYAGAVTVVTSASIGTNYVNTTSGLGGTTFGDLTLAGQVTGSATLTKVGANTLKLTGVTTASTLTALNVALGKVVISGVATTVLGTTTAAINVFGGPTSGLIPSNTLQLDYTALAASVNRTGAHGITLNGGTLLLTASTGTTTAENESLGTGGLNINGGFSLITLDTSATSSLQLSTTTTGTISRTANTGTVLIRGNALGTAASSAGKTNVVLATAPTTIGQAGAAASKSAAIIPWIIVDDTGINGSGVSFAFNGSNGLRALAANEMDTTFTASNNILINTTTPLSTGAATLPYVGTSATAYKSTVINSLTFSTAVNPTLTVNAGLNIALDSGGILATVSATIGSVGGGFINASGTNSREMLIYTAGSGTVLTINAAVGGVIVPSPIGLTKSGEGSVILGAAQNSYTGQTRINLGTLKLAPPSPTTNALFYIATTSPTITTLTSTLNASALTVNAGGTLDLNGNSQTAGNFTSVGILPGTGGIVTNTSTTAATLTVASNGASDWAGQITGDTTHVVKFVKTGAFTLSLHDNNTYAGSTTIQGNVLSLIDQGRLSGTSGIFVRNAVLQWNDTGIQAMSNRLATNVPITLDGGAFQFISRSGTSGSASIGNIILMGAANELRLDVGVAGGAGAGIGTATLNLTGTLTRSTGATLNFYGGTGAIGDNPSILFTTAPTLKNGIIGGWATVIGLDSNVASTTANAEFATYDPVIGVRALTAAMQTSSFATSTSTSNLRFGDVAITVPTGGAAVNTLTWNGISATRALSFGAAADTLTLTSGGLLLGTNNFPTSIGSTSIRGQLSAGTGQSELYLHVGAGALTVNSAIIDNGVSGGLNLVLDGMSQSTGTPTVTLAGANTYLGTTYVNGLVVNLNNIAGTGTGNAVTGNLIISGGNNNATDSLAIANAQVVNLASQQIADTASVTVRGGAQWALNGFNETIGSLVFNSQGGSNGGNGPIVQTGAGTLTIAIAGGITATSLDDVRVVPALLGLLSLPSAATVTVDPVANAAVGVNGQVGLTINSNIVSTGSITKAGGGVLQLGGVSYAVNTVGFADGSSGEIVLGANSNYASTTINLSYSGNILDMRGQANLQVGAITGVAGSIIKNFSVATAGTLVTGDSTGGTFAGTFSDDYFSTGTTGGVLNVTKIGSGTWVLTGNSASVAGTFVVNAGTVTLSGTTGKIGFAVDTLSQGGVLTLDNSGVGNAVNDRLGGAVAISNTIRILNLQGGTLNYKGNNNATVSETLGTLTMLAGQSTFNLTASTGAFGTTVNLGTLTAQSATNTGTLVIATTGTTGILGGAAGTGHVNVLATTPGLVSGIRPDIIGSDSTGSGLVTSDANGFRLLTPADTGLGLGYFAPTGKYLGTGAPAAITPLGGVVSSAAATSNVFLGVAQNLNFYTSTTINSLTLNSGGGVTSTGGGADVNYVTGLATGTMLYSAAGTLNTLTLTSGAIVAKTGNAGFTGGVLTQGAGSLIFHTLDTSDTLNVNAYLIGAGALVKADSGILNLQKASLISGATFVNAGELDLSAGANTLLVIPTSTVATTAALNINGGTVDLKGSNQAVASLTQTNGNGLPGGAGTVTNTGTVATLYTNPTTAVTVFVGTVAGKITFDKSGANILVLNNADGRNAPMLTNIRGGTLALKDSGTISNGGAINVYFSALTLDNAGFSALSSRTGASAINLNGGTLTFAAKQGTDALSIAGPLNLVSGASTLTENLFNTSIVGTGASVLTLASLNQAGTATLNFTIGATATGVLGAPVLGVNGLTPVNGASNFQILITSAPTLVNGIIGGWAVVGGIDFASYRSTVDPGTGALGVGALGSSLNATTPFGAYSASLLSAGVATDNISTIATVGAVTSRTINSLKMSTAAATVTMNTLGDTLAIATGGLITNFAASVITGGRLTAGASTNTTSTLYNYANATATINSAITNNSNGNLLSLVKSGTSTTTLNVQPTVWTFSTTASSNVVTLGGTGTTSTTAGLAIGQVVSAAVGQVAGSVIIGITDATHYTLSAVATGSATAAGTQFSLPTSQVLTLANTSFTTSTITVPPGSVIYPGMSVALASAAAGGGVLTAATVASVSGSTVTLNGSFTTLPSTPATVLFGAIAASTATAASASTTSGSNVVTLASSTNGLYIGEVLSGNTSIPGGATITAITSPTTFTISAAATATVANAATTITTTSTAPAAQSLTANTTLGSNTLTLLGTATLFTGQSIQGNGIPQGATITGISQGTGVTVVTLSQNATATGSANEYFGLQPVGLTLAGATIASSSTVTVGSTAGLVTGQSVNGAGIAYGTTISSITDSTHFVLSLPSLATVSSAPLTVGAALNPSSGSITGLQASTTPGSSTVTVASTNGLYVGMPVTGNSTIPANEFITAITGTTTFTITTGTGVTAGTNLATTIGAPAIGGYSNAYSGPTVVNQGTLNLGSTTVGGIQVPGDLIINNAAVSEITNGQIASASNVTFNGNAGVLTLVGNNALATLSFNGTGGATATTNITGGTFVLSGTTNAITAVNDNYASTPTLSSATIWELGALNRTITTSGLSPIDLILNNVIQNVMGGTTTPAGIIKAGSGSLVLGGGSTFNGGVQLNEGTLILGASSTPSTAGVALLAGNTGPLGIGTLNIAGGTTLMSGGSIQTVSNSVVVNGDFTFGGPVAGNAVILNGTVNLGSAMRTITVTSPQNISTLGGAVSGTAGLTKAGDGVLVLGSTSNSYSGPTIVSGGLLQLGAAGVIPDGSALIVSANGAFDVNGKAETLGSLAGDTTTTGGMITNSFATASTTLTIGADNTSTSFAGVLTDTKAGTNATGNLQLAKTGTGVQTLTGVSTYAGATTIGGTAGGLQIQNPSSSSIYATLGNTAIAVGSGVSLMPTVGSGAPTTIVNAGSTAFTGDGASVTLNAGGSLDMRDNALGTFNIIEGATFVGAGLTVASTGNIIFDIGSVAPVAGVYAGADKINVTKTAAITSGALITLNAVTGATGITTGIIPLITTSGGFTGTGSNNFTLSSSTLTLSGAWGSKTYNVTLAGAQDTTTQTALSVTVVAPTMAYWSGALDGNWSTNNAGGVTNWRTDATSNVDTQATPDATTNVFFNTTTPAASFLTTNNLTAATSIASLTFTSAATGAVTLGNNGSSANTLTVGAGGITHSSSAGSAILNMSVILGAAQTWTNNSSNALSVNGSTITGSGKNLTVGGTGDTTIAAAIQTGAGTVTKQDAGKLIFTGTNTYTGPTVVTGGNLQVGSGGTGSAASSAVTVTGTGSTTTTVSAVSGAPVTSSSAVSVTQLAAPTLSGTGSVGAVTLGSLSTVGVLRPGDAGGTTPGKLTFNGALTVNSGSQIQLSVTSSNTNALTLDAGWNLAGTAAAYLGTHATAGAGGTPDSIYTQWNTVSGNYSSLSLTGQTLSLGASSGGTPTILVQTAGSSSLASGDIFKLMDWASITSGTAGSIGTPSGSSAFTTASDLYLPDLASGLHWDTSAFASYGIVVIVVPEPSRMVLMLFGLAALFMRRRRTQTRSIG